MKLRNYQEQNKRDIYDAWDDHRFVLSVLPTGAGKTVIFSSILAEAKGLSVVIAHRREILGQISLALAKYGVKHSILGPVKAAREFAERHREEVGRAWIDPNASVCVASVDTIQARRDTLGGWGEQVRLWVQDEAHHVLTSNKWGKVASLFPNAKGLGVTATPIRADKKKLGLFTKLIQGPGQRQLIDENYLTDYRIFAAASDLSVEKLSVTPSGDFNRLKLAEASERSHIVGDVVEHYHKIAPGEMGVTFVTDVKTAGVLAEEFTRSGVPAAALSAKSSDEERATALRAFRNGELKQLVNVDLFGEGFDLPEIRVVAFARPTASYGLYCQQFGRVLRPAEGKGAGKIIDHVGNVLRHGLPDKPVKWSLETGRKPKDDPSEPPLRTCLECFQVWESYSRECPHCGFIAEVRGRSLPEQVEGELSELTPEALATMRADVARVDCSVEEITAPLKYVGAPNVAIWGLAAKHRERQSAQEVLRFYMAAWGGRIDLDINAKQIRFYREFGVDVLSAQALGRPDAQLLTERIINGFG